MNNSILQLIRANKDYNAKNSVAWFQSQIRAVTGGKQITSMQMLQQNQKNLTTQILPGKMYMFVYSAKHKDTLPYWDKFPLIIPFAKETGAFKGLNFHYLPYTQRILLLDALIKVGEKGGMRSDSDRLRMSWQVVSSASKMKLVQPCVKMYLNGHVKSRFIEIPKENWATAIMLPTHAFVGDTAENAWKNYIKG